MKKENVHNEKQAFLYLTDCLLATVEDLAQKKNRKKYEYERHIQIAQTALNWVIEFKCVEKGSRADSLIKTYNKDVNYWATMIESIYQ